MMDLEFIIDIDHMSKLMVDEVMTMAKTTTTARPNKYPLVSSHSGFTEQAGREVRVLAHRRPARGLSRSSAAW